MRAWPAVIAVACCTAAAGGIAYLHGFDRALGHEDWRHRPELVRAYSDEVVVRAGPCVLLAAAAVLAALLRVWPGWVAAAAVLAAGLSTVGTYITIREYIRAWPGALMPTTTWDAVNLVLWPGAAGAVLMVLVVGLRRARGGAAPDRRDR